jgi:uncharacterized OB-fold protein
MIWGGLMTKLERYHRPLPGMSEANHAFWRAAVTSRLVLPHCQQCGNIWFPPSGRCPGCLSVDLDYRQVTGRGRLWSWIIMHRRYFEEFEPPYLVAFVELEEGPMLISTIVGAEPDQLRCDMMLEAVFEPATTEMSILKFRPVSEASN